MSHDRRNMTWGERLYTVTVIGFTSFIWWREGALSALVAIALAIFFEVRHPMVSSKRTEGTQP